MTEVTLDKNLIKKKEITLFWFRRDLRLNDNVGLYHALIISKDVLPVFIFDTDILDKLNDNKDRRVSFIHSALMNLQAKLLKSGSSLLVKKGKPLEIFEKLLDEYSVQAVYANHDYEHYAIARDKGIYELLKNNDIPFHTFKDQVIFEKSEVMKNDGTPYSIFTPYSNEWKQKLTEEKIKNFPSEKFIHHFYKTNPFQFPTLEEIGFEKNEASCTVPDINMNIIRNYHLTRNIPSVEGTTKYSIHLRFGTVSIRSLVQVALNINTQWLNELIWREFFMMILFHFPQVEKESFKKKYDFIKWRNNEGEFKKWCDGETGYPIVDAGMRELNATGLMHNRVRMIVASFLIKHLLIDWRWGEAYFAEKLLDYEMSSNNGNWQWAAGCGCDAAPYFRIFNPYEQVKKFDPELIYIHKWVKNLNEPDYPTPIVEHKFARERALKVYKEALEITR